MSANQDNPTPTPGTGGLPPGYGGTTTGNNVVFRQGADGRMWQSNDGGRTWDLAPPQFQPQEPTLPAEKQPFGPENRARGIYPQSPQDTAYQDVPVFSTEGANRLGVDPNTLATVKALTDAGLITAADARKLLFGDSLGSSDPYAGARLAEQIRANRMQEVLAAQNAITQRTQNALSNRLEGSKFAITPDMAASGYFPGLGPNSPVVHAGLADPFKFQPVAFNPDMGLNVNQDQLASDLARLRGAAGVGG